MKYIDKYPHATENLKPLLENCSIFFSNKGGGCWNCKEVTHFMDMDFQAYLCSEECSIAKWDEYCRASVKEDKGDEQTS